MSLLLALITAQAVDTPRADAVSLPVTYERIAPYQALAFVPVVAAPPPETVTLDKWLSYSVGTPPLAPRPPSVTAAPVLADIVGDNLVKWFTGSPTPAPAKPYPPSAVVAPVFVPDGTLANADKWLTTSPIPAPARKPQNVGSLAFVGDFVATYWWRTDSPIPLRVVPRPQSDPAFVQLVAAPVETVTLDKWLSYSVGPFPPPPRPSSAFAWGVFTPAPAAEVVTVDKWLGYDARPRFPVQRVTGDIAFVIPPDDIALALRWLTASPLPAPARQPQNIGALAWGILTPPPPTEGPITLDKWLTDSPRQRPSPPYPPSVYAAPDEEPPPDVIPPAPPSGGAGSGGRRRQFPFRNRYDDPELFEPPPEPVPEIERYVEGDPAEAVAKAPAGPSSLTDLGQQGLLRKPPPAALPDIKPAKPKPRVAKVAKVAPTVATTAKPEPPPRPLTDAEEREEEMLILRMLGFL